VARPSKYQPEYSRIAHSLALLGATDSDLAKAFDVSEQTINAWKKDFPEFFESLKAGKHEADNRVVRSLFERATGYSHPEDKIFQYEGSPVIVPTIKQYAPDTTAAIFWLKNRRPSEWRDKMELDANLHGDVKITIGGDA
jgi:DNA-binding XRE family transcriptional regulator